MRRRKKNTLSFSQKKKIITPKMIKEIFSWITVTIIAVALAAVFVFMFGMQVKVIGDSMEPSAYNGQTVLVNKLVLKILGPSTGDIVVFLPNGNVNSHYYVKRVVAGPGDKVQIVDGLLYINGEAQTEDQDKNQKQSKILQREAFTQFFPAAFSNAYKKIQDKTNIQCKDKHN